MVIKNSRIGVIPSRPSIYRYLKSGKAQEENYRFYTTWRLAAFKLSGLKEIPEQQATEKEIAGQMWKMTTKTDGKSIILKMGDGIKRVIGG